LKGKHEGGGRNWVSLANTIAEGDGATKIAINLYTGCGISEEKGEEGAECSR